MPAIALSVPPCAPPRARFVDLALRGGERWYVVHTHPHRETSAAVHLESQGFRTFTPRYSKTVRHARRVTKVLAPLFPRYLFVILDTERDRWHSVNNMIGVVSLIMSKDRPLATPTAAVETLISASSSRDDRILRPDLVVGQTVQLVAGPFAERFGVLEQLDDNGRVRVLLEMMGAWYPIQAQHGEVLPVS